MMRIFVFTVFLLSFFQTHALEIFQDEWEDPFLEKIPHECGVALVRLRKPLLYYIEQYKDPAWGMKKLLSLMEKQRNRGQDGAGVAAVQFNMPSGQEYLQHIRSASENAIESVFSHIINDLNQMKKLSLDEMSEMQVKCSSPFVAESFLGHVRYATHSGIQLKYCQPFVRSHGVACRHFALAGNFNMTNTPELLRQLEEWGLSPISESDTQVVLDMIAHYLDKEYKRIANDVPPNAMDGGRSRADWISQQIDLTRVLSEAAVHWDGGYVFCGILGNGDAFVCRDPAGIRPGYYFINEEVIAAASEKVALMDVFDVQECEVLSVKPGYVMVIKRNGQITENRFAEPMIEKHCTFERIYFSKAHDPQIYEERKALGRNLANEVFNNLDEDLSHAIFTYAPNSSLSAFQGLVEELTHLSRQKIFSTMKEKESLDLEDIKKLAEVHVRAEYLITKNQKLRTFISSDGKRKNLVAELYEVTQGVVTPNDTLVVIDDSIVRGTTLKESLIKKLIKLNPKKILIVSSAPPVLYPDCYGIDMSQIGRFVGFQAACELLKERQEENVLKEIYTTCLSQKNLPASAILNSVKKIYERFSLNDLSHKVAQLLSPSDTEWKGSIEIIYQTLDGLKKAMPHARGDWYFSGDYPTPGGYRVLNNSYLKWFEGDDSRSY
jgi:amidophosphoribosyltransferase